MKHVQWLLCDAAHFADRNPERRRQLTDRLGAIDPASAWNRAFAMVPPRSRPRAGALADLLQASRVPRPQRQLVQAVELARRGLGEHAAVQLHAASSRSFPLSRTGPSIRRIATGGGP